MHACEISMRENRESPMVTRLLVMPRPEWFAGWQVGGRAAGERRGRNPLMHDRGKSDGPVVPAKPPNNAQGGAAEVVEGRGPAEGNAASETRPGRRAGVSVSSELDRVRQVARKDKDARFTALLHHVTVDRLREAYRAISPKAAPGVDGVTWEDYGQDLEGNLRDLHARVHRGATGRSRLGGCIIPKPDGRLRPLGVAALEDKILQRARGRGAERHLRAGLPRFLVRVPARALSRMMRWTRSRSGSSAGG